MLIFLVFSSFGRGLGRSLLPLGWVKIYARGLEYFSMNKPILYFAITSHGFGHAVRSAAVAATIQQMCPDLLLILVTAAPRWLLEAYITGDFIHRQRSFDVGVIQADSLTMDKDATWQRWQEIKAKERMILASEVDFIKTNRVGLVLGDIPPLASEIAAVAGVPCWMLSNFGWDFIYRDWGGEFTGLADQISRSYGKVDRLFRLPLHEPMTAFPKIQDVGLTGGDPRYSYAELKATFGLHQPQSQTILLTFGGLGLNQIPYQNLALFPNWQFITFDRQAPDIPNLVKVTENKYRPVDFMPFVDQVVSKPGYSTFAEALRLDCPITSLTRKDFAEATVLLEGIRTYGQHQIINPEEFFQGNWNFLHRSCQPPNQAELVAKDGNETIAQAVINYLNVNSG